MIPRQAWYDTILAATRSENDEVCKIILTSFVRLVSVNVQEPFRSVLESTLSRDLPQLEEVFSMQPQNSQLQNGDNVLCRCMLRGALGMAIRYRDKQLFRLLIQLISKLTNDPARAHRWCTSLSENRNSEITTFLLREIGAVLSTDSLDGMMRSAVFHRWANLIPTMMGYDASPHTAGCFMHYDMKSRVKHAGRGHRCFVPGYEMHRFLLHEIGILEALLSNSISINGGEMLCLMCAVGSTQNLSLSQQLVHHLEANKNNLRVREMS